MGRDLLEGLSEAQAAIVTAADAPLAVVAGPGAGKTRVLTRRIAWRCRDGAAAPDHTLVLTFSRRAAGELLTRLGGLGLPAGPRQAGVTAGTFHAVAWAQICRRRADLGRAAPALLPRPGRLLGPALAGVLGRDPLPGEVRGAVDDVAWARLRQLGPADYGEAARRHRRRSVLDPAVVAAAWATYTTTKDRQGLVDLDDLLEMGAAMLEQDTDQRAAAHWRYRHVYVDEYQDLNPAHLRLLRAWVGGRPDVCVVGDPDQAVYGFNGASPDLFERVAADWPGIRVVALREDFRSSPEIVSVTEALRATGSAAPAGGPPRHSRRGPGPLPRLLPFTGEGAEAAAIATALLGRHGPGQGWGRTAVLARTNARLHVVAAALSAAGIPWRLRDARPLADRPQVRAWLRELSDTAPVADLADVLDVGPRSPDSDLVLAALDEYLAQPGARTVAAFRTWLDATGVTGDAPTGPGVDLSTFHRAKGLEWDAVWVAGVEEGTVPLASTGAAPASLAEEHRLLYVALSRAATELTVSWVGPEPSRWIAPLTAVTEALAACPAPPDQRRRLGVLRDTLGGEAPAARRRRAALLAWRDGRARAARVPPQAVLPDAVVGALATADAATVDDVVAAAPGGGQRVRAWAPELVRVLGAARSA